MNHAFNNRPAFVVDAMLGNIAKKLRLFGFDTKYESSISDEGLVNMAFSQERILVTKDRTLYHKIRNTGMLAILPERFDETGILVELLESCQIRQVDLLPNCFARCVTCNGSLISVNKTSAIKEIPYNVIKHIDIAYRCSICMKVYWNGTHTSRVNNLINEINCHLKKSSIII